MQCSVCGNDMNDGNDCATCGSEGLGGEAKPADVWAPDPSQPMDFKATMAASARPDPPSYMSADSSPKRMNSTWLTLGILIAGAIGVMIYLALN